MNSNEEAEVVQEINVEVMSDGLIKLHSFGKKGESGMQMNMKDKEIILDFIRDIFEKANKPN